MEGSDVAVMEQHLRTAEERELWKRTVDTTLAGLATVAGPWNSGMARTVADETVAGYRLRTPAPALPKPLELEAAIAHAFEHAGHGPSSSRAATMAAEVIRLMGGDAPKGGE